MVRMNAEVNNDIHIFSEKQEMAVGRCGIFDMQALKHSSKSMSDQAQILGTDRRHMEKDLLHI